ncbi:hypothetical protein J1N35_001382 [Gossypium stocksii]|uniref:Uncharacterized protein n=1 Tax=Gossypium stocksii TaxID=47602 RepID=A0A9D3WK03_9ROSI|nr:hypothetical protein J1N35_001382 [Gossypium stocksii]
MTNTGGESKTAIPVSKNQKGLGVHLVDSVRALLTTAPWDRFFEIVEPTNLELTLELCSTFQLQSIMSVFDELDTVQFCLGGLVCQLSVLEFDVPTRHLEDASHEDDRASTWIRPPQYRLVSTNDQDDPKDITDNVPPPHEDPHPPPLSHRPITATLTDISEQLTCFKQQCFEQLDSIDATLRQIHHHLYISPSVPSTHGASNDEDL